MKLLSISIPNYNRRDKLCMLIEQLAEQILHAKLENKVQICISDDCSPEDPTEEVFRIKGKYNAVEIKYIRKEINQGMDYNFKDCVLMADAEYCWILGNDDLPKENGVEIAVKLIEERVNDLDILITPFDHYGEDGKLRNTIIPIASESEKKYCTQYECEKNSYFKDVKHNAGIFGFLSNIIFKRKYWVINQNLFLDKMNSIFIQMYMNIKVVMDGANVYYVPDKIVRNYADDETNNDIDRFCKILFGLDGVVEYFFDGEIRQHMKTVLTDTYITGKVWDLPDTDEYKIKLKNIESQKNELYKIFFIPVQRRKSMFEDQKVVIYGAGKYGKKAYRELLKYNCQSIQVADSNEKKQGELFEGIVIQSIKDIVKQYEREKPIIVVANNFYLIEMIETLKKNHINQFAIIT